MRMLEYSPLMRDISVADTQKYIASGQIRSFRAYLGTLPIIFAASLIAFGIVMLFIGELDAAFWTAVMLGFAGWIVRWAHNSSNKRTIQLLEFAKVNGCIIIGDIADPGYKGTAFTVGTKRTITEAFVFPDGVEMGTVAVLADIGTGKKMGDTIGYVRVPLQRSLPNMLLDAHKNNMLSSPVFMRIFSNINKDDKLALEGDFNESFTLYAPRAYHTDALYVFTPDVMAALIDASQMYDIEIVEDELYIYSPTQLDIAKPAVLQNLFAVVDAIAPEIRDQTKRYRHEAKISKATGQAIAPSIVRKKPRVHLMNIAFLFANLASLVIFAWIAYTILAVATGDTSAIQSVTDALNF